MAAKLFYNRDLDDPAQRAAGMFSCISLGISDTVNDQFAREGLAALDAVQDEAVRADLIGNYVSSIPGTPPWDLNHVLAITAGISDQRLRARALTFAMMLGRIGDRALHLGLELDDPWALAAVIFGWEKWRDTPSGFTGRRWAQTRLEAAREVPSAAARARYLALVSLESKGSRRVEVAAEAFSAAREVKNPWQRAQRLYFLAVEGLFDRREATRCALHAARLIADPYRRYDALARIGYLLTAAELVDLLGEIFADIHTNSETLNFVRLCEPPGIDFGISWE